MFEIIIAAGFITMTTFTGALVMGPRGIIVGSLFATAIVVTAAFMN